MSREVLLFGAVFLACLVEGVEAVTIVLAAGITRGWRSTWIGVGGALLTLAVIIAILGSTLTALPIGILQLIVGGLLLTFGLQWLRKAVLRAAGLEALHDEDAIFARELKASQAAGGTGATIDPYAFAVSFKGVLLEGLEVAFIVVTFGANQHDVPLAVVAAASAVVLVIGAGALARAPLSRVPENTLKYAVGVLLSAFGTYWGAEGAGARWPAADASILILLAVYLGASLLLVMRLRRGPAARGPAVPRAPA